MNKFFSFFAGGIIGRINSPIAAPGFVSENIAIVGSYLAILLIFICDLFTTPEISFHILYVFPIIFIALHSSKNNFVVLAVALALSLQLVVLFSLHDHPLPIQICLFSLITLSNCVGAFVTRSARASLLACQLLSTLDPLTQLFNRRAFDKAIHSETARLHRYGSHFSVVMIDLDDFKGLNDTMGHQTGDKALVALAKILRVHTRQTDTTARLGGDEFVILMPNTKAVDCESLCQSLCQAISKNLSAEFSYSMSASIGYMTAEHWMDSANDILAIADHALYRAKSFGKNCVVRGYANDFMMDRSDGPRTTQIGLPSSSQY